VLELALATSMGLRFSATVPLRQFRRARPASIILVRDLLCFACAKIPLPLLVIFTTSIAASLPRAAKVPFIEKVRPPPTTGRNPQSWRSYGS
jgi:hypothetical protein